MKREWKVGDIFELMKGAESSDGNNNYTIISNNPPWFSMIDGFYKDSMDNERVIFKDIEDGLLYDWCASILDDVDIIYITNEEYFLRKIEE